jgi:hypothetical protein
MKTITMINPKTSNSYEIPVPEMMDYMLQGLVPFDTADNNGCQEPEDISLDDEIYRVDVDASEAVDRDIETACFNEEIVEEIVKESDHTKENVITALRDINKLNAAIAWLGDLQTEDEMLAGTASHLNGQGFSAAFARTGRRLWQWITGKDAKTMEERCVYLISEQTQHFSVRLEITNFQLQLSWHSTLRHFIGVSSSIS